MKKFAVMAAVAFSLMTFGSANVEAATIGVDNAEIVEMGPWTKFRDHITGKRAREKEAQRERERYEYENHFRGHHNPPPPPPRRHGPPPPPPRHW